MMSSDMISHSTTKRIDELIEKLKSDKPLSGGERSNGKKAGVGTAICHDDDEFDIYTGAKLALERLEKNKKETEMTDWEKFVKGTANMRVPKKYIRSFLDRAVKADLRIWGTMADWCLRCLETDGDDIIVFVDHISKNHIILADVLRVDRSRTVDYIPGMK